MRRLHLVAGPNGAGKSTFVRLILSSALPPEVLFVNADEIASRRWPEDPEGHAYEAAEIAARTRDALVASGESFIAETVFSHESKLELIKRAQSAGYVVHLHAVCVPEELSVARVAHRVGAGGHSVPENKIRERHRRLWPLVRVAAEIADSATFYDNSTQRGPGIVARLAGGEPVGRVAWPNWSATALTDRWPNT